MRVFQITGDDSLMAVAESIKARSHAGGGSKAVQDKLETTRWIVEAVRKNGDAAVAECTERFDGVALRPDEFEVSPQEMDAAMASVDPALIAILERAKENIRAFHAKNLRQSWEETYEDGSVLGQRITPIERAGVYVPGGKAFYPSSVLMNIIPARVAGVKDIIMTSPPSYQGTIHPGVLAAARVAGATRVFRVGGAQAVAALAYGTDTIPAVSKITGPGNTFVTAAKSLVRSVVEIDSEAGPSEVVVIADEHANPAYVAAELLAQAEHDEEAASVLMTPSQELAAAVQEYIAQELQCLSRTDIIRNSLENFGMIVIVRHLEEAVALTNLFAPEHLSIQTVFPRKIADQIVNAGAIMMGTMTPVAVGDYYAGPNHILPTCRRARFSSPLSAEDFRKTTSILFYSQARLQREAADIAVLANAEGLRAHARSVEVRAKPSESQR